MIHKVFANKESFNEIEFTKGLNIIVGEKNPNSKGTDTCNGVGKTTLLRIIDFCLGSDKNSFNNDSLKGWEFSIKLDLFNQIITVSRLIGDNKFKVVGNMGDFIIQPNHGRDYDYYSLGDWKRLLGNAFFNININPNRNDLTYRSLFKYFLRLNPDTYSDPFRIDKRQSGMFYEKNTAFLLGLKWEDVRDAYLLKKDEKNIKELKKIYNSNMLNDLNGNFSKSKGLLETKKIKLSDDIKIKETELSNFKVNKSYEKLEKEANQLNKYLSEKSNERLILEEKVNQYKEAVQDENNVNSEDIEKIYKEMGFLFEDSIKKTLKDAKTFHKKIIKNRKSFLDSEILSINNNISDITQDMEDKNLKLTEIMQTLNTSGVLKTFNSLNDKVIKLKEELESINIRIEEISNIEIKEKNLESEWVELESYIKRDYEDYKSDWEKSIRLFSEISGSIYPDSGDLIINRDKMGYHFDINMFKDESDGVNNVKIFCYDVTLINLVSKKYGLDFLIRDSNIFNGVDDRTKARI